MTKKHRQHSPKTKQHPGNTPVHTGSPRKLSLCMIVRNESEYFADCLKCIAPAVDEIIVVDTGSTDNTREIAKSFGARLYEFPWCDDFSAARNKSIEPATGDYILWLDADDRLDAKDVEKIKKLKTIMPLDKGEAYFFNVRSDPKNGQGWAFLQVRIFPNIPAGRFELPIHEQVSYNLQKAGVKLVKADITIRHIGNPDNATIAKKAERNLRIIEKYMETHPDDPIMHYQAGRTKSAMLRQKESVEHMKFVINHPDILKNNRRIYFEASVLLGRYFKELGQFHAAVDQFENLLREYPDNDLVRFYFGECLVDVERYTEARQELEATLNKTFQVDFFPVKVEQMRFQQYYLLGKTYQKTGSPTQSAEMYEKALDLQPKQPKILESLGVLCLELRQYARATECFKLALEQGATSFTNYANLGLAYRRLGRFPEAEETLIQALDLQPDCLEALTNLGYMYLETQQYQKALNCFARAEKMDGKALDIRLTLSELYFRQHDLEHLVKTCEGLLFDHGIAINRTLNSLEDLAVLYEGLGDQLLLQNQKGMAFRALTVSFLVYPLSSVFDKMVMQETAQGKVDACLKSVQDSLSQHVQDSTAVHALQGMLTQLQTRMGA